MKFEKKADELWVSPEGYEIKGNDRNGYEAFDPNGKMIVMWAIEISLAVESCREDYEKKASKS